MRASRTRTTWWAVGSMFFFARRLLKLKADVESHERRGPRKSKDYHNHSGFKKISRVMAMAIRYGLNLESWHGWCNHSYGAVELKSEFGIRGDPWWSKLSGGTSASSTIAQRIAKHLFLCLGSGIERDWFVGSFWALPSCNLHRKDPPRPTRLDPPNQNAI